ncbi:MAG: polysaccharide deacetylase family protein [Planctomycetota bacterium]
MFTLNSAPPPLRLATISVDVDPLDLHLQGYGVRGTGRDLKVYDVAIPRLLEIFSHAGIRATFFFVASDIPGEPSAVAAVKRVAANGHEIASHSLTHSIPFRKLPTGELRRELALSKARLEEVAGCAVAGFRAPNWDMSRREIPLLAELGYKYDASAYPSLFLCAARLFVSIGGGGLQTFTKLKFWPDWWERSPFVIQTANGKIVEFPIATHGFIRFPIYHTTLSKVAREKAARWIAGCAQSTTHFSYAMHAIDVLTRGEVEFTQLQKHPTVRETRAEQVAVIHENLATIQRHFRFVTYKESVDLYL